MFSFSESKFSCALKRAMFTALSLKTSILPSLFSSTSSPSVISSSEPARGTMKNFGAWSLTFGSPSFDVWLLTRMMPSKCWACSFTLTTLDVSTAASFCSSSSPFICSISLPPFSVVSTSSPSTSSSVVLSPPADTCSSSWIGSTGVLCSRSSIRSFSRLTKPDTLSLSWFASAYCSTSESFVRSIWYRSCPWSSTGKTASMSRTNSLSLPSSKSLFNSWSNGCSLSSINSLWRCTRPLWRTFSVSCSLPMSSVSSDNAWGSLAPEALVSRASAPDLMPCTTFRPYCWDSITTRVSPFTDAHASWSSVFSVSFPVSFSTFFSHSWSRGCIFPSINNVWRFTRPFGGTFVSCSLSVLSLSSDNSQVFGISELFFSLESISCTTLTSVRSVWRAALFVSPSERDEDTFWPWRSSPLGLSTFFSNSWSSGCSFPSITSVCRLTRPFWGVSSEFCSLCSSFLSSSNSDVRPFSGVFSVGFVPTLSFSEVVRFSCSVYASALLVCPFNNDNPSSWATPRWPSLPSLLLVPFSDSSCCSGNSTLALTFCATDGFNAAGCLFSNVPLNCELSDGDSCASSSSTKTRAFRLIFPVKNSSVICSKFASSATVLLSFAKVSSSLSTRAFFICSPAFSTYARSSCSFFEADILRTVTSFFMSSLTFLTRATTLTPLSSSSNSATVCTDSVSTSTARKPSTSSPSCFALFLSSLLPRWSNTRLFKLSRCFSS